MTSHRSRAAMSVAVALICLAATATSNAARADLTLTQAAIDRGFTLTTFASNFPNISNVGPIGFAFRSDGAVLVSDYYQSLIYLLPNHADNQTGPYPVTANHGTFVGDALGMAQVQVGGLWKYYLAQGEAGQIIEVTADGNYVQTIVSGLNYPVGIAPYPPQAAPSSLTGHLFVNDGGTGIWDIDPVARTMTQFLATGAVIGSLTFSPDGSTIYVPSNLDNVVRAYNTATPGAPPAWESCAHPGGPDGIAIGLGSLTGYLYLNYDNGDVWELGLPGTPHDGEATRIASGGAYGNPIAADPNVVSGGSFPSLLLTQIDRITRLKAAGGGFFGPPTSSALNVAVSVTDEPKSGKIDRLVTYPNPFEGATGVSFAIAEAKNVDVGVFDVAGRLVRKLQSGRMEAGAHYIQWDGLDSDAIQTKAGIYFVRVQSADRLLSTQVVRVK